ncbi:hypothetical protein J6T21_01330 [Candidatus Saccharibacteria bacterium]|nr:hypothetical protein [Candidatus Saccharibacteria bacterium]
MDYGHTAQNGQVAPQFDNSVNSTNGRSYNMMPNASVEAAQNFGANAMGAYQPVQAYPADMAQQPMPQMSQIEMLQMMPQGMEQQMVYAQQGNQTPQTAEAPQMNEIPQMHTMQRPQMAPQPAAMTEPQAVSQVAVGNALDSLKKGVDLKNGMSAIDISKMDSAIQLLDQMGPRDFYEQFSTVAETTVDNNYGLKVE